MSMNVVRIERRGDIFQVGLLNSSVTKKDREGYAERKTIESG